MIKLFTKTHFSDPIPGGCALEFPLETSPFLRLSSNGIFDSWEFQRAQAYEQKDDDEDGKPVPCDETQFKIKYEIYYHFLNDDDSMMDQQDYFYYIEMMTRISWIRQNAFKVI